METINLGKEIRRRKRREWAANMLNGTAEWVSRNKEGLAIAAPFVAVATKVLLKTIGGVHKSVNLRKEKELKELYCYDRSLGHYWKLRKPLNNRQWTRINERREHGETLANILKDMDVLK